MCLAALASQAALPLATAVGGALAAKKVMQQPPKPPALKAARPSAPSTATNKAVSGNKASTSS